MCRIFVRPSETQHVTTPENATNHLDAGLAGGSPLATPDPARRGMWLHDDGPRRPSFGPRTPGRSGGLGRNEMLRPPQGGHLLRVDERIRHVRFSCFQADRGRVHLLAQPHATASFGGGHRTGHDRRRAICSASVVARDPFAVAFSLDGLTRPATHDDDSARALRPSCTADALIHPSRVCCALCANPAHFLRTISSP